MNIVKTFFCKILVVLFYARVTYMFTRSKKHVLAWGEGTYGEPSISCFDGISKLSVGSYVSFASNVALLLGANHKKGVVTTYPYSRINSAISPSQTNDKGDIIVGNDVWVGYGATIIGPVVIGNGAIIGAGAVVVNDIPPFAVAVGVPAKVVKYRFNEEVIKDLQDIAWWDWKKNKIQEAQKFLYTDDGAKSFIEKYKEKN